MDIKSMQDRFRKKIVGNITLVSIIIIGCLCISTYCHSMYSYYKSPSSHSEQYFNLKNYVQNWKHNAYQQNLYIYSVTDYLNVFENPQNKLNSYSGDSGWINYLVYNTKTKKYLTNSGELQDYISNNNERVSIDSYIQNNIASKYYTSANAVNSLVDRYESINHAQYIKNNSEYVLQFWIPQKLFEKGEELGKIKTEDINNKVLSTVYLLARLLFTGIIIIILISLYKSPKEEVIKGIKDSIIYKILLYLYNWILGIKEDLFNRKSIVFKFFIYVFALIVLGIFIAAFMYREIIIPMYLILIVYSIFKLINFLTTLQKIINYSSDFSIDALKKARFEEKNLTKLRENIASLNEGFNDAVSDRIKNERLKAELVTNISHDLKTPLTSIINYTDILLNKDISDEEKEDYIRILNTKGLKLKLLIEGLFEISKITSGKEGINKEEVNIVELISQSIGELSSSINESNLDFIMGTNSQDVKISLDGKKMSRVFENLITNATKYSLRGTRVYIDVNDFEDRVNISFKNISKDKVELDPDEIFNRFTRGDKTRNSEIEGSGLGLAIAKSIVDIHDGCIEVTIDGDLFKVVITLYK